jgi:hypothetical protein
MFDRLLDRDQCANHVTGDTVQGLDFAAYLVGRLLGLVGQILDLRGHHRKAPPRLTGASRFDGRIEGEQIDLAGDVADEPNDASPWHVQPR